MRNFRDYQLEIWVWLGLGIAVGLGFGMFLSAFVAAMGMRPLYATLLIGAVALVPFGIAAFAGRTLEQRSRAADRRK